MIKPLKLVGTTRQSVLVFDIMNRFEFKKCIISHSIN